MRPMVNKLNETVIINKSIKGDFLLYDLIDEYQMKKPIVEDKRYIPKVFNPDNQRRICS